MHAGSGLLRGRQKLYVADRCMGHPNIVQLWDAFWRGSQACLVFEVMDMSLLDMMRTLNPRSPSPPQIRCTIDHTARALTYLHNHLGFIHTDVQPANILINPLNTGRWLVKLGDLGCTVEASTEPQATPSSWACLVRLTGGCFGLRCIGCNGGCFPKKEPRTLLVWVVTFDLPPSRRSGSKHFTAPYGSPKPNSHRTNVLVLRS